MILQVVIDQVDYILARGLSSKRNAPLSRQHAGQKVS